MMVGRLPMREAAVSIGHLMMNSPTVNATPSVTVRFSSMEMRQRAQSRSCQASRNAKRSAVTLF
jgi:hypothetical protein